MNDLTVQLAAGLLHGEALALDERRWQDWLNFYVDDAIFWVPAWKSETEVTEDPDRELSLIYYRGREGLVDRIWRLESGLSIASNPLRRTAHLVTNVLIAEQPAAGEAIVKASGAVHVYDPRRKTQIVFFSLYRYTLREEDGTWRIAAKTVRLLNDQIPSVLDIYMV